MGNINRVFHKKVRRSIACVTRKDEMVATATESSDLLFGEMIITNGKQSPQSTQLSLNANASVNTDTDTKNESHNWRRPVTDLTETDELTKDLITTDVPTESRPGVEVDSSKHVHFEEVKATSEQSNTNGDITTITEHLDDISSFDRKEHVALLSGVSAYDEKDDDVSSTTGIYPENNCENRSADSHNEKPVEMSNKISIGSLHLEGLKVNLDNVTRTDQPEISTDETPKQRNDLEGDIHDLQIGHGQEKCLDEVVNSLKMLIGNLNPNNVDWAKNLYQISKILRTHSTEIEQMELSRCLSDMKFVEKLEMYLEIHEISSLLDLKSIKKAESDMWPIIRRYLIIVWVACDKNVNFCQHILTSKIFIFLVSELQTLTSINYEHSNMFLFIVKAVLGILHNISRHVPSCKWNLRNEGVVTILRTFLRSEVSMVRVKSLIVLSYILSEAENEIINSDDDNFVFIFTVLKDALKSANHQSNKYGMSVAEVLKGLSNLAINDENKLRMVRNGLLPLYQEVLADGFPEEKKLTIVTLWSLAFHHYNKRKMREMPGIMGKLYELQQCDDEEICHAARGTFWELENMSKSTIGKSHSSSAEKDVDQPHIMISYQWDSQAIMLKVKNRLKHAGYKVWMDVEHMTGSTLEAMALAVEKAAVILICMSQKYKNSPNCRTEAEYVYRLRKDFVPLRLQQEYVPDGWLGILVGTRLYFDMYTEEVLDTQLPRLVKELRDRGKISPTSDMPDHVSLLPRRMLSRESVPLLHHPVSTDVTYWGSHDISEWLTSHSMANILDGLPDLDGPLLLEMQKIQKTAPEYFYSMLSKDLGLSTVMVLKFSKAIRCLR